MSESLEALREDLEKCMKEHERIRREISSKNDMLGLVRVIREALTEKEDIVVDELESLHGRVETNGERIAALGGRIERAEAERPKRNKRSTKSDDWFY